MLTGDNKTNEIPKIYPELYIFCRKYNKQKNIYNIHQKSVFEVN